MKTIAFFIAMLVLSISACAQKATEPNNSTTIAAKLDTTLPWLQAKIWEYQSKPVSNPARSVIKTMFEGKPVYYVPPICCDIPSELYAEDGKLICYPSGGFTGAGDLKCPKFKLEYLDYVRNNKTSVVWQDTRKSAVDTKQTRAVPDLK